MKFLKYLAITLSTFFAMSDISISSEPESETRDRASHFTLQQNTIPERHDNNVHEYDTRYTSSNTTYNYTNTQPFSRRLSNWLNQHSSYFKSALTVGVVLTGTYGAGVLGLNIARMMNDYYNAHPTVVTAAAGSFTVTSLIVSSIIFTVGGAFKLWTWGA